MIQVELVDEEEVSSKCVSEVDEKRGGERGGEGGGGGGGGGEGVIRVRSGLSEASEGGVMRVRGLSEGEERRVVNSETGETGGQHFILAVSVGPEGKGGPKRFAISCLLLLASTCRFETNYPDS